MNRSLGPLVASALTIMACQAAPPPAQTPPAAQSAVATPPATTAAPAATAVKALRATEPLPQDVDDPAVWINRTDPSKSLVLGTMKVASPDGALAVYGLDGKVRQLLKGPNRPNNVDVEYGLDIDASPTDIAVVTERLGRRLRAYAIAADGSGLRDISSGQMPILAGAAGDEGAPMGVGLYRRPKDGAVFAIVSPKTGPKNDYLWQYRLADDGTGRIKATFVRRFGTFSGLGEIEAVAVDDELGFVYYADEGAGIHKWHADPDAAGADKELALFATTGYQQDREGLGIYALGDGKGYIVSVDQLQGESIFHIYRREGESGKPHDHSAELFRFQGGADGTDGLDVTSGALGPEFPDGMVIAMNSASRNFLMFPWRDIAAAARPPLVSSTASGSR
jgi:3-phytase